MPQSDSKWLQVNNVRAVLASSAISLRQNSHLEFLLSHLFPVWPGGMRLALELDLGMSKFESGVCDLPQQGSTK